MKHYNIKVDYKLYSSITFCGIEEKELKKNIEEIKRNHPRASVTLSLDDFSDSKFFENLR